MRTPNRTWKELTLLGASRFCNRIDRLDHCPLTCLVNLPLEERGKRITTISDTELNSLLTCHEECSQSAEAQDRSARKADLRDHAHERAPPPQLPDIKTTIRITE